MKFNSQHITVPPKSKLKVLKSGDSKLSRVKSGESINSWVSSIKSRVKKYNELVT